MQVGARILLVEDYRETAVSTAKLLKLFGYDVQIASDGLQAVASAIGWSPDFVLLDLGLPGLDGFQVAAKLRQEPSCRETVIIALTGYSQPEHRAQTRAAGIKHHLVKPVDPEVLLSLLLRPNAVLA